MPKITIENAQIKTAAVEIKTLTISGKQLTLSVFRQIKREGIIDYDAFTLRGIPWGIVNYFFDSDKGKTSDYHYNIVWQYGNELRRCVVDKYVPNYSADNRTNIRELKGELSELIEKNNRHVEYLRQQRERINELKGRNDFESDEDRIIKLKSKIESIRDKNYYTEILESDLQRLLKKEKLETAEDYKNKEIQKDEMSYEDLYKEYLGFQEEIKEAEEEISTEESSIIEITNKMTSLLEPFKDLPHLFIAV